MTSLRSMPTPAHSSILALPYVVLMLFIASPGLLWSQNVMNPEKLVSSGSGMTSDSDLHAFETDLITSVFVENGQVKLTQGPWFDAGVVLLPSVEPEPEDVQVEVTSSGGLTIVYRAIDLQTMEPEIFVHSSLGGLPTNSVNLSSNDFADISPKLTFRRDLAGRFVAWEVADGGGPPQVMLSSNLQTGVTVAEGEAPAIALGSDGSVHLSYIRLGELIYRVGSSGTLSPEMTIDTGASISDLQIEVGDDGVVHLLYLRSGELVYRNGSSSSGFGPTMVVVGASGAATEPLALLQSPFPLSVLYLREGEVMRRVASATGFLPEEALTATPGINESGLAASIDPLGFLHVQYLRNQDLYYANDVPAPVAAFSVSPDAGEAPLEVQFTDESAGYVSAWLWDFGDGHQSIASSPLHVYSTAGTFTVSLLVYGAGESDDWVEVGLIEVEEPSNRIWVPDVGVLQGQPGFQLPVLADHDQELQGYQLAIGWDVGQIELQEALLTNTIVSSITPEFVSFSFFDEQDRSYLTLGLVVDIQPPFDGRTVPPGSAQRLLNLAFDVPSSAPPGLEIEVGPVTSYGSPPISNVFTVSGLSVIPVIDSGIVTILVMTFPPPFLFLRGDVDLSFSLNLTDCIALLGFLFNGGAAPVCYDAADLNDSGAIDVSDPIYILNFLFIGGNPPAYPFPGSGLDPTPDDLGDC